MNGWQALKFGHFGINCFDVARTEDFRTRVMGWSSPTAGKG